jgi:hypothetical protein
MSERGSKLAWSSLAPKLPILSALCSQHSSFCLSRRQNNVILLDIRHAFSVKNLLVAVNIFADKSLKSLMVSVFAGIF